MAETLKIYTFAGALVATAAPTRGSSRWSHKPGEDGSGAFSALGDLPAAALGEDVVVRINNGTKDIFAFVPIDKDRRALDAGDDGGTNARRTALDLSGPGVRSLLHAGQIYQEDTSDCAEPADTRWFGWMSQAYDDSAWVAPVSAGKFVDGPWATPRPDGWPDPMAEYIWTDQGAFAYGATPPGDVLFRKTFTTAVEQWVTLVVGADDEHRVWLDGTEMLSTIGGGPFQWQRAQQRPLKLCPGTHTIAVMVRNLPRPAGLENLNYGWLIASLYPATSEGKAKAANQLYKVFHDHSAGTFTLTASYETTSALPYDASAAAVEAALEALPSVGAGNVSVTGSGTVASPWEIEFIGDRSSIWVKLEGTSSLTGGTGFEVDEWVRGSYAAAIVHTDTTWKMLDYPATVPGLTATHMLRLALEDIQARGVTVLDNVTPGFTDTTDTDGTVLPELVLPVSLDADLHRLAILLEESGYLVDVAPDLTLQCWADRGTDRSATVSLTAWSPGVRGLKASQSEGNVKNVVRVRTGQGWHETVDAASIAARGRWEDGTILDGFATEAEADVITGPLVAQYATPARTTTLELKSTGPLVPYRDFDMADIVTASAWATGGFDTIPMRLAGVVARIEETHTIYAIELVS